MPYTKLANDLARHPDFIEVNDACGVIVDLKYAGTDNFLGEKIYAAFDKAYLHRIAFDKLTHAIQQLKRDHPQYCFKVFDCTRPPAAQQYMWNRLQGSPEQAYLADPAKGSIHSFGFALDLTLVDENDREMDMGTAFDAFTPLSEPRSEQQFFERGKLSRRQVENRALLRGIMHASGFTILPIEWWHFDALPPDEVRRLYRAVGD